MSNTVSVHSINNELFNPSNKPVKQAELPSSSFVCVSACVGTCTHMHNHAHACMLCVYAVHAYEHMGKHMWKSLTTSILSVFCLHDFLL